MKRDKLLKRLINLPADTDVVVKVGDSEIDIAEIVNLVDARKPNSAALLLHPGDLRDTFTRRHISD